MTKTSELTGAALDWAVTKTEFPNDEFPFGRVYIRCGELLVDAAPFAPSTDWSQGGPIIERERIDIRHRPHPWGDIEATGRLGSPINEFGPTPLIAAMRCHVASRLGDTVDVPEELL